MTTQNLNSHDPRISLYVEATQRLSRGDFGVTVPTDQQDPLGRALRDLAHALETRQRQFQQIDRITSRINAGLMLHEVLENVFEDFRPLIPYDRIGLALIEDDGTTVRAQWAKSDVLHIKLRRGYEAPLAGSSLETIMQTGQPRILNDLEDYLRRKPSSDSTRLIVEEGMRSSLTCPLIANGLPVGFLFFSSTEPHTYRDAHVDIFQRIAGQLSVIVEKGRLTSELAAQKNAIERQNDELRRLNELKNTFVGIAAHDLRSPLGVVQMAVTFLLDSSMGLSDEERQSILEDVARQTDHMLDLINDLLDVTQIEGGTLTLHPEPIRLADFLASTIERHARLAAAKETRVILQAVPTGTATADSLRLRQVLDNLISNAVKFSPGGSTVRVFAQRTDTGWRISVQDEGPGITPEDRQRLFQDFARLSARPTAGEKSTGLGLAISRRVVEAHGGEIGVDSEPGHGATFWFTLPQ